MTFLTTPILSGSSALTIPLPNEAGYQWSWVQERKIGDKTVWERRPDVSGAPQGGPWTYTPQTILEGWLRLVPELLIFDLLNADGKAILVEGTNNDLTLTVSNRQGRSITFSPATPVGEGSPPDGSIFYIHLGSGVPQASVADIVLQAAGWSYVFSGGLYGNYWAATPAQSVVLDGGAPCRSA